MCVSLVSGFVISFISVHLYLVVVFLYNFFGGDGVEFNIMMVIFLFYEWYLDLHYLILFCYKKDISIKTHFYQEFGCD